MDFSILRIVRLTFLPKTSENTTVLILQFCQKCGKESREGAKFCTRCGAQLKVESPSLAESEQSITFLPISPLAPSLPEVPVSSAQSDSSGNSSEASSLPTDIIIVTTPSIPGCKIKSIMGSGILSTATARTKWTSGKRATRTEQIQSVNSLSLTEEFEKAEIEAIEKLKTRAQEIGANAVVGVALQILEIHDLIVLVQVTGTAVVTEPI
jgi:uncharacterized protein YbjQ (UPF0145 family)